MLQFKPRLIENLKQDLGHKTRDTHHWETQFHRYSGQKQQLNQRVDAMKKNKEQAQQKFRKRRLAEQNERSQAEKKKQEQQAAKTKAALPTGES